jgi:hypothetical protein
MVVHPALYSWREQLPAAFVRALAVFCALVVLSIGCAWLVRPPALRIAAQPAPTSGWTEVERPFPAFSLFIPEAGDVPSHYAIRRDANGGRLDILSLGEPDGTGLSLQVEIYRPGNEAAPFRDVGAEVTARATQLAPSNVTAEPEMLDSKFGPLSLATFNAGTETPRACVAFAHAYDDPHLQIFGWFCQAGEEPVSRETLACALDRLTLLSAASEPKVTALFAQAELRRTFCGQRSPLLAPTPKYRMLWKAVEARTAEAARQAALRR